MRIEGLTPLQCEIADVLWSLGTVDDCQRWLKTLPLTLYQEALVVMELMIHEALEESIQDMDYYPDAEAIIEKMRNS